MNTNPAAHTFRWRMVALLTLLLVVCPLAACGGNEPAAQATTVTLPTEAPAESTAEPATAEPPITEPPTPTREMAEPTVAPTEAAKPTPAPTEAAAQTSLAACQHDYFPIVEGRVMRYLTTTPGFGQSEFTQTTGDVSATSFTTFTDAGDGQPVGFTWHCVEGGLLAPEMTQFTATELQQGMAFEYVEVSGITIPPAESFQVGETWPTHYVANSAFTDDSGDYEVVQTIDVEHEVTAIEPISVPAGDYPEAVRVETSGNIHMDMTIDGVAQAPSEFPFRFTSWYVAGVGLVRAEFGGLLGIGGSPIIQELVAVEE